MVRGSSAHVGKHGIERAEDRLRFHQLLLIAGEQDPSFDERLLCVQFSVRNTDGGIPRLLHTHVFWLGFASTEARGTLAHLQVIHDSSFRSAGNDLCDSDRVSLSERLQRSISRDLGGESFEPFKAEISDHPHSLARVFANADELRHAWQGVGPDVESWWWWGHDAAMDVGVFVGFELRGRRFDYRAGLVRAGQPYLLVEELDGTGLRSGLEIKPPEMWADHQCDVPFEQWSLGNEAHGVLLDDPMEALNRAFGTPVAVTFDIEWFSSVAATAIDGGYEQVGEIDARIELIDGVVEVRGPARRLHVWGTSYRPPPMASAAIGDGLRAPYRRTDGGKVVQLLTDRGWVVGQIDR